MMTTDLLPTVARSRRMPATPKHEPIAFEPSAYRVPADPVDLSTELIESLKAHNQAAADVVAEYEAVEAAWRDFNEQGPLHHPTRQARVFERQGLLDRTYELCKRREGVLQRKALLCDAVKAELEEDLPTLDREIEKAKVRAKKSFEAMGDVPESDPKWAANPTAALHAYNYKVEHSPVVQQAIANRQNHTARVAAADVWKSLAATELGRVENAAQRLDG